MKPAVLVLCALCVVLPLAMVGGRMWVEGRAALAEADALAGNGDVGVMPMRIEALGRAARRLGGPAATARAQLATLGRSGVYPAWEELRGAILATRWLVTPDAGLLAEADAAIAQHRGVAIERLSNTGEPSRALSLVAILGLVVFVAAAGHGLFRGRSGAMLACAALGLGCLVFGLWRA